MEKFAKGCDAPLEEPYLQPWLLCLWSVVAPVAMEDQLRIEAGRQR